MDRYCIRALVYRHAERQVESTAVLNMTNPHEMR